MKRHYQTFKIGTLCHRNSKENEFLSSSRFSYKIGDKGNCKICDKLLIDHAKNSSSKCTSFESLGYKTECHWRNGELCNCFDNCNFKKNYNE